MQMLKRLLLGSPLEPLARRVHRLVVPPPADAMRHERDTELALARMRAVLRPDANCVDIGSHRGEWLAYFAAICPAGRHIAVEPLPAFARALRRAHPEVEVHEVALAADDGKAGFTHALDLEGWSGLRPQPYPVRTRTRQIEVRTARLEGILAGRRVDFIKIDVEGAELLALEGGRDSLSAWRPLIYFESAAIHAAPYGVTPEALHAFFAGCGLAVTTLAGEKLTAQALRALHEAAAAGGYGPAAQTNFFAVPA